VLAALGALLPAGGCTDARLAAYRDDPFLAEYRYALGENYLEVDGLRFCYQEFGRGPTVVIVPGLGTSIDFWQLNIPALAEHFHVLAVDPPGVGKSDKPDASYELPWMVEKLVAFLDAKNVEKASLIGGSLGGHLALLIALDHPERVEKLVLMGSTGAWDPPGFLLAGALKLFWNEELFIDHVRRAWPDIFHMIFKYQTEMTRRILRYQMAQRACYSTFEAEGRACSRAILSIFFHSCLHRLREVRCPVLLVWGEDDQIHPVRDAKVKWKNLPVSRLVILQDSAHEAMVDQYARFNEVVVAFLRFGIQAVRNEIPPASASIPDEPTAIPRIPGPAPLPLLLRLR
jgi:4,5:9,10-diseco-3-hydroxy-5,9,17-trioxoandrosta-1(10),2-diene-4-oate hydrolase